MLLDWLFWLLVGLTLVGIATTWRRTVRGWGTLLITIGLFGWVYYITQESFGWAHIIDFTNLVGSTAEVRLIHVTSGVLFSLSWVTLGYALWSRSGAPTRTVSGSRRNSRRSRSSSGRVA